MVGDKGAQGAPGAKGPKGFKGSVGLPGLPGKKGERGKDVSPAYKEIYPSTLNLKIFWKFLFSYYCYMYINYISKILMIRIFPSFIKSLAFLADYLYIRSYISCSQNLIARLQTACNFHCQSDL